VHILYNNKNNNNNKLNLPFNSFNGIYTTEGTNYLKKQKQKK